MELVIATRSSPLALYQAEWVKQQLLYGDPQLEIRFHKVRDSKRISKDSFVKACEEALLDGYAELAVHSAKDVPMNLTEGLIISAFCHRSESRDALITHTGCGWQELRQGARVGTASLRRKSELLSLRPDLAIVELRGNIETRLAALGELDAIVLSAVALQRLGYEDRISHIFSYDEMVPAAGQGALAVQQRNKDEELREKLMRLNHQTTSICVLAERSFCRHLGADCYAPVGSHATFANNRMHLRAMVGNRQEAGIAGISIRDSETKNLNKDSEAEELGVALAERMLAQGAAGLLH